MRQLKNTQHSGPYQNWCARIQSDGTTDSQDSEPRSPMFIEIHRNGAFCELSRVKANHGGWQLSDSKLGLTPQMI
jgi:hypothetical protein